MRPLLLILAWLIPLHTASARLGETEEQLIERYAKPFMRSPEMVTEPGKTLQMADNLYFRQGDWTITARLTGRKCESISYTKPGEWTDEQFNHVLEANGGRSYWEERKTGIPKMHRTWLRRDSTTAEWRMLQSMTLSTPAFERAREAVKKRAKENASKLPKI